MNDNNPAASGAAPADAIALHAAIVNIPVPQEVARGLQGPPSGFYRLGHRDARHAAAELVLAALASREAQQSPAPLTDERIDKLLVSLDQEFGMPLFGQGDNSVKMRALVRAALASPQVAPALTDEDDELCQLLRAKMAKAIPRALLPEFQQWVTLEQSICYSRGRNEGEEFAKTPGQFEPSATPVQVAPTKVYLVATGEVVDGMETYTRHEGAPPPLCDSELLYSAPVAPQDDARDAVDTRRMNWLETMAVNVRVPLRCGSRDLFWSIADDEDGFVRPGDIRSKIDAAMRRSGPAAKPTEEPQA